MVFFFERSIQVDSQYEELTDDTSDLSSCPYSSLQCSTLQTDPIENDCLKGVEGGS